MILLFHICECWAWFKGLKRGADCTSQANLNPLFTHLMRLFLRISFHYKNSLNQVYKRLIAWSRNNAHAFLFFIPDIFRRVKLGARLHILRHNGHQFECYLSLIFQPSVQHRLLAVVLQRMRKNLKISLCFRCILSKRSQRTDWNSKTGWVLVIV